MHGNGIFQTGNRIFIAPYGHEPTCFLQSVSVPCGLSDWLEWGHLPTAAQQGKLFREEWRWLSLWAIAPRDGQAGTVHPCYWLTSVGILKKARRKSVLIFFGLKYFPELALSFYKWQGKLNSRNLSTIDLRSQPEKSGTHKPTN